MRVTMVVISIVVGALGTVSKGFKSDPPAYSIIEIGQNIEKSPGNLKKLE